MTLVIYAPCLFVFQGPPEFHNREMSLLTLPDY